MQKPFSVSDEMLREIDEQVKTTISPDAHDAVGPGSGPKRTQSGHDYRRDIGSPPPGPGNFTKVVQEAPTTPPEDAINPSHYRKHPSGIECIEVTRHLNFNIGNAIKYLWRYQDKVDAVENLKKAQWYIDDEIRRLEGKR